MKTSSRCASPAVVGGAVTTATVVLLLMLAFVDGQRLTARSDTWPPWLPLSRQSHQQQKLQNLWTDSSRFRYQSDYNNNHNNDNDDDDVVRSIFALSNDAYNSNVGRPAAASPAAASATAATTTVTTDSRHAIVGRPRTANHVESRRTHRKKTSSGGGISSEWRSTVVGSTAAAGYVGQRPFHDGLGGAASSPAVGGHLNPMPEDGHSSCARFRCDDRPCCSGNCFLVFGTQMCVVMPPAVSRGR